MTTYNTYQEAKIANPKGDIYKLDRQGCFVCPEHGGVEVVMFTDYDSIGVKCSHEDYCMTVEEFLADGHKFFEGDVYLNIQGDVRVVNSNKEWIDVLNGKSAMDNKRYILRAAALEEKPKPTKFVKVEESIFDLKGEFESGELYCKNLCVSDDYTRLNTEVALFGCAAAGNIYRQVEIDWRDEVKEAYDAVELPVGELGRLYMGEGWSEQEFIKFCHLVASLTEKPANG